MTTPKTTMTTHPAQRLLARLFLACALTTVLTLPLPLNALSPYAPPTPATETTSSPTTDASTQGHSLLPPDTAAPLVIPTTGLEHWVTVTAYYSPLPGQSWYVTGSYEGDIRLNGQGTHAADGTPVFPGLLAAAPRIPYGTTICLPGFGCGTKHDTGQAIVNQGDRSLATYDRVDVWAGWGEPGLRRAVDWGVQSVPATLFPPQSGLVDYFPLNGPLGQTPALTTPTAHWSQQPLSVGSRGPTVRQLQSFLRTGDHFHHDLTDYFGPVTRSALQQFQQAHSLPQSGTADAPTRQVIAQQLSALPRPTPPDPLPFTSPTAEPPTLPSTDTPPLTQGAYGYEVYALQYQLGELGFLTHAASGYFGQHTHAALVAFQLHHDLIPSADVSVAGWFGPLTARTLAAQQAATPTRADFTNFESTLQSSLTPSTSPETTLD